MNLLTSQSTPLYGRVGEPAKAGSKPRLSTSASRELNQSRLRKGGVVSALISVRLLPLTGKFRSARQTFLREQLGSSLMETAVVLPLLVLLLVGSVDYGRGFYTAIEVSSAAESAAMYGTTNPTDVAGIASMAKLDAKDIATLNVTASYGCECADGSGAVVSCLTAVVCSDNAIRYVDVSTSTLYTPIIPYPLIPSSFTLSGHSRMRMSSN